MTDRAAFEPIGVIRSSYTQQKGTPIQPVLAGAARGSVEIYPRFEEGLDDIEGFDRIWLIYLLDRAGEPKLKIKPYLDTVEHGIFATRSPTRPNGIGLSPVRLLSRKGRILEIEGVDILDGTPLLDIKPYVARFDSFPQARSGWLEKPLPEEVLADERFERKAGL